MPSQQLVVSAFVASPGDVAEERGLLEDVVAELNLAWSRVLGLRIELLKWETHVIPGIADYPQQVINRQIGNAYDIFIGILWARFGTPTPESQSGTLEEFQRALSRYRENPGSVEIMFYFKDEPISPSDLDPKQLSKVLNFKNDLGEEGVLYWRFSSQQEFAQLLRLHLSKVAQKWQKKEPFNSVESEKLVEVSQFPEALQESDEELGFLDHIEEGGICFERATESLGRMALALGDVGTAMTARTEEIQSIIKEDGSYDIQAAKKIANTTAQDLDEFSTRTEAEISLFYNNYQKGLLSMAAAASLSAEDFSPDLKQLQNLRSEVFNNYEVMAKTVEQVSGFKDSMARLPRLQSVFNKSKRRAVKVVDELISKMESAKRLNSECFQLLDEVIMRISQND